MLKSPESRKPKISEAERKKLTPKQCAILIEFEFLRRHPELKSDWFEKYLKKYRDFFDANKELCVGFYKSDNKEEVDALYEIVRMEVMGPSIEI